MASIIDIHPHVISTDTARYPLAPLGGTQSTWSRDRPTSYQQMIAEMDAAGVAKSAIVQASTAYGHDNSYVAEAIAAHPKRFTGVFSVDVLAPDAVEKMKHWIGKGFSGMRLFTTGSTMPGQATWFDDPRSFAAWEYAGAAGIPVCMQMTPQGFPQLRGLMERFPRVRMILDHLARPRLTDGPPYAADKDFFELARYPQVYLKVTPINVEPKEWGKATPDTFFAAVIKAYGASRIAWGSNFPATAGPLSDILKKAQAAFAFASVADRDWVFGKTAQSLYPRLAD
ncbi:MAG TPA: amidohydrolase family protein [Xanthobacteraceae bacterium]|nr:amidohydrolase family protein [Xanthobacteraceae bacterium]